MYCISICALFPFQNSFPACQLAPVKTHYLGITSPYSFFPMEMSVSSCHVLFFCHSLRLSNRQCAIWSAYYAYITFLEPGDISNHPFFATPLDQFSSDINSSSRLDIHDLNWWIVNWQLINWNSERPSTWLLRAVIWWTNTEKVCIFEGVCGPEVHAVYRKRVDA